MIILLAMKAPFIDNLDLNFHFIQFILFFTIATTHDLLSAIDREASLYTFEIGNTLRIGADNSFFDCLAHRELRFFHHGNIFDNDHASARSVQGY
ncbi:MAG: hypothetical protein R6U84_00335, partial [Candidatus Cloacimonadales bacterium]